MLAFAPYEYADSREFLFCIVRRFPHHDKNDAQYLFSGLETNDIFSDRIRESILSIVIDGVSVLLEHEKPEIIYRVTADSNPPERALRKHRLIAQTFYQHGYNVWPFDGYNGKQVWMLTLLSEQEYRHRMAEIEKKDK